MALCRFSDYQCDLYIYESEQGIECHIAYRRRVNEPKPPVMPIGKDADNPLWNTFWANYEAYHDKLDECALVEIRLPYAGESRTFGEWGQLLEFVTELKELGYEVPDWVIEEIKEENETEKQP